MDYQTILGMSLMIVGGAAFALGLYAINGVLKYLENRILIIICAALLIWSVGLGITVAAESEEIAKIGHMIAPIGWGLMSGLLLHFTLIITDKKSLLKRVWIYILLYLPGILMVYAFTILPLLGENLDIITITKMGWVPKVENDAWDYLFYIYYVGFTIINLIVLFLYGLKTEKKYKRRQSLVLGVCYLVAYIFGSLFDIVLNQYDIVFPQIAPVFSIIPIVAIVFSIRRYGFLRIKESSSRERILKNESKGNVYFLMGFVFFAGSLLNLFSQKMFFQEVQVRGYIEFSIFLVAVGVFMLLLTFIRVAERLKELIVALIYSVLIPYITLRYISFGSATIWVYVFLLLIVCLLYNRRVLLFSIAISSLLTQILIWIRTPEVTIEINASNYIVRIGLIFIASLLAIYVNVVYVARLKENAVFAEKQKLVSEISREFITVDKENLDEKMEFMLKLCGTVIGTERVFLVLFHDKKIHYNKEWLAEGIKTHFSTDNMQEDLYKEMMEIIYNNKVIYIPNTEKKLKEMDLTAKILKKEGIGGVVAFPVREKEKVLGVLGMNSSKPIAEWDLNPRDFLDIISNTVSDTFVKIEKEGKIMDLAYYDQLTKLSNRFLFREKIIKKLTGLETDEKGRIAVISLDLDGFKAVNDTMGHDLGDQLLIEFAKKLSVCVKKEDLVARFSGDEFFIFLELEPDYADIQEFMNFLMSKIQEPLTLRGQEIFITASAGVALYPMDGKDSDSLIKNADTAMYAAKKLGINQYLICSESMKSQIQENMKLTNYLYRALEKEELSLVYQPLIESSTEKIKGFEALLRWEIPGVGKISPAVFIPLAEQTGLINPIGDWVMRQACTQLVLWQNKGWKDLRMAVNISLYQLNNPDFIDNIKAIMESTGVLFNFLELEITESIASKDEEGVIKILSRLKELGVSISLDDFGTEYSSLSRLKRLPVDRIKMDMQFVHGIGRNKKDQAVAEVVMYLAKSLDLEVVAEGVETELQYIFLRNRKCEEIQGYYFYKPGSVEEINEILEEKSKE